MVKARISAITLTLLAALLLGCGSPSVSLVPKSGIVPQMDRNGVPLNTLLPAGYDPAKTYPWVIFNHGADQAGKAILEGDPSMQSLAQALSAAGYFVVSSNYRVENCWGNASCVEDLKNLYDAYSSSLNLDPRPFVLGVSMGGMVTWNAVTHGAINPRAIAGIFPACNLADMYQTGYFVQAIQADYNFSGASQFAVATKGYDPTGSESLQSLAAIPILMWASDGDTTVRKSANADLLASQVKGLGGSVNVIATTGNHGDPSNFQPDILVQFFNTVRAQSK